MQTDARPYAFTEGMLSHFANLGGILMMVAYLIVTWMLDVMPCSYYHYDGGVRWWMVGAQVCSQDFLMFALHLFEHKGPLGPEFYRKSHKPHHRFVNPRLFDDQLVYIINHAEDAWLAFDAATAELVRTLAPQLATVRGYIFLGTAEELPEGLDLPRVEFYEEILDAQPGGGEWPEFDENRAAMICYTSGTTGNPKGVVYSHRSIVLSVVFMMLGDTISGFRSGVTETFMPFAPLFHGGGWFGPYSAPLMGANLVLPGRDFTAPALYDLLEDEGVTLCFGVPTIWECRVSWESSTLRASPKSMIQTLPCLSARRLPGFRSRCRMPLP